MCPTVKKGNVLKSMRRNWIELSTLISVFVFAAVLTILKPIEPYTLGYFADIMTPLIIFVGIVLLLIGVKRTAA